MMFVPSFRRGSMASTARRGLGDLSKEVALLGAGSLVLVALRTLDRDEISVVGVATELREVSDMGRVWRLIWD
jgi:hypothetical protein